MPEHQAVPHKLKLHHLTECSLTYVSMSSVEWDYWGLLRLYISMCKVKRTACQQVVNHGALIAVPLDIGRQSFKAEFQSSLALAHNKMQSVPIIHYKTVHYSKIIKKPTYYVAVPACLCLHHAYGAAKARRGRQIPRNWGYWGWC